MQDTLSVELIRGLYDYHRWANRRLFTVASALPADVVDRDLGPQWSMPTLRGTFAHIYGADWIWLSRWKGVSPTTLPSAEDVPTMAALRDRWDALEAEQRAFVDALAPADLERAVEYRSSSGQSFRVPLGALLQHVANHATHHRSEAATMITLVSGSPPDTGVVTYQLIRTGQTAGR